MSGPKVVRVITREELVAAGESLLRRLDAALAEWEHACTAVGVSPADQKASRDRRNALEQMFRTDRFMEFGQAAVAEIDFLESDAGRRREKAAQAYAQERARLHSGKELAKVLLRQTAPSAPERVELQRAAAGELGLKDLDAVLARARQTLFQPASPQLGANQQALAARLAGGEKVADFEVWRQKQAVSPPRMEELFGHISELELLGQAELASELHQEMLAVVAIAEEAVREMRFDSLVISLRKAKEDAVALEKLRRKAAFLETELARYQAGVEVLQALQAAARGSITELKAAVTTGEQTLTELQATLVADARRRAVLDGLQQLGYQVQEELSTVTSAGGRLIVRNPAGTGYGVEIAAGAGMERLQLRTVAFETNRDASGDIPAEQRWCDDFETLQGALKAQGADVIVERAMGVGTVPVKVLSSSTTDEVRRASSAPRQAVKK
jgi:hypothetical protein